jgi:hypothetical protein
MEDVSKKVDIDALLVLSYIKSKGDRTVYIYFYLFQLLLKGGSLTQGERNTLHNRSP